MTEEKPAREFLLSIQTERDVNRRVHVLEATSSFGFPPTQWTHVIEYSAYQAVINKVETLYKLIDLQHSSCELLKSQNEKLERELAAMTTRCAYQEEFIELIRKWQFAGLKKLDGAAVANVSEPCEGDLARVLKQNAELRHELAEAKTAEQTWFRASTEKASEICQLKQELEEARAYKFGWQSCSKLLQVEKAKLTTAREAIARMECDCGTEYDHEAPPPTCDRCKTLEEIGE